MNTLAKLSVEVVDELMGTAVLQLDKRFGDGYSSGHPSVVMQLTQAYSTVYVGLRGKDS